MPFDQVLDFTINHHAVPAERFVCTVSDLTPMSAGGIEKVFAYRLTASTLAGLMRRIDLEVALND